MKLDTDKVRWHRDRLGWTLDTLAEKAEVAEGTALRAEHGEDIRPSSGRRIARALGVDISELVPEPPGVVRPKAPAREAGQPKEEGPLIDRSEIREWLREQGHMDRVEFLAWAEDLELDLDDDGYPQGIESGILELRQARDRLLDTLKTPAVKTALFGDPAVLREGLTGDEWLKATFKPGRLAWELANEIRHEYAARELALVNYSNELFVQGETSGYLGYGPPAGEVAKERHQRMLEARRVLEESYAKAVAV